MVPSDGRTSLPETPMHVRITAKRSWFGFGLKEMWQFRGMIRILAVRDVKLRYRQTALGLAGVVLAPLVTAGVLAFVFGQVADLPSEGVPYVVFSYAGFLGWNLFANVLGRASGALLGDSGLVSRIYVPRLLLPVSGVFVALVDFAIASVILVALMAANQLAPSLAILSLPLWIAMVVALGLGIGVALSATIVYFRDVGMATAAGLQTLLYLTPVAYSATAVPDRYRDIYALNPIGAVIEGFRWALIGTQRPESARIGLAAAACVAVLFVGSSVFTRLERGFADVI